MGLIVFEVHKKGKRSTKHLNQELLWYEWAPRDKDGKPIQNDEDHSLQGKMHRFKGGKLDFGYDFNEGKMTVSVAPVKIITYDAEDNEKEIKEWIDENKIELKLSEASGVGITVSFPSDKKDVIKKALEYTNFTYEIV